MTKLIFIGADGAPEVPIPDQGVTFGRSSDCDLPIPENSVSGHHGMLRFEGGRWMLHDTNSSNGSFVNGRRVTDAELHNGDTLQFGDVQVRFVTDAPSAQPAPKPAPAPASASSGLKLPPKPGMPAGAKLPPKPSAPAAAKQAPAPKKAEPKAPAAPSAPNLSTGSDWKAPELKVDPNYRDPEMSQDDVAIIADLERKYNALRENISQVVIGQADVVEEVLMAVFAKGHALLMGVPGLAKTLLISTLSHVLDLGFKRVQFTPDLMPSDITGTDVLEENKSTGERQFRFVKGPIFTNMLLADEINRTPPKTQAALLEAMQEHHITVGTQTYDLPKPFFVLATQNPIEQEGTYPLPEAQLDRFMFFVEVDYPSLDEELEIVRSTTVGEVSALPKLLTPERLAELQAIVPRVPASDSVVRSAVELVQRTRPNSPLAPDFIRRAVSWGAGPRASQFLILGAKARALLQGRFAATVDDVRALARPVLRHRVITNFHAESEGIDSGALIDRLLAEM